MSAVRGCDTCGDVFFENAEGWSTGTMTVNKKNPATGRMEAVPITQDKCPNCTSLMSQPLMMGQPAVQAHYDPAIPITDGKTIQGHKEDDDKW
jgi:hypothetical protein